MDFKEKYRRENVCTSIPRFWKESKIDDNNLLQILEKVERVIASCKTEDQLNVAKNFMEIAFGFTKKYFRGQYDEYDKMKFENKVTNLILAKYEELEWS